MSATISGVLRLLAFLIPFAVLTALPAHAQEPDIPALTISGGDLPHSVTMAPADVDAFRRRINLLPRLEDRPDVAGGFYIVTTSYWSEAVRLKEDEDALDVDVSGRYYPEGGFVRATIDTGEGSEAVWMVISLRQRAILDRYIRLASEGVIGEEPAMLETLALAGRDEVLGVQFGTRVLTPEETAAFWGLASGLTRLDLPVNPEFTPPEPRPHIVWITVTLPEGRAVQLVYNAVSGTLVEPLSQEAYAVSQDWLSPIIGGYDPTTVGTTLGSAIEQEEPAGSWVWWPVMLGGGAAGIGVALWLRRGRPQVG